MDRHTQAIKRSKNHKWEGSTRSGLEDTRTNGGICVSLILEKLLIIY